jgi:phosphatidylglycerol:prolipoprotein diacylglycerol transferase
VQVRRFRRGRADDARAGTLRLVTFGCEAVADAEPQALGLSYWFDAADEGEPYPVKIRFAGRRVGTKRKPGPHDSFSVVESVERVVPGSGPATITARVFGIAPGEWQVTATPVIDRDLRQRAPRAGATKRPGPAKASSSGTTVYAPIVRVLAPGARLGAWPALVSLGVVVALITQALLASRAGLGESRVLSLSLFASLVGLVGAKVYYLAEHRGRSQPVLSAGMCIQGFVIGAIGTIVVGSLVVDLPVGVVLDVTAPGLLFGMTIGRFGCFFGGCCAGRPTASRWGLWSSDRRLGVRRIPTQLLESALALVVGLVALLVVWTTTPSPAGVVFVGAMAAYTLGRQLLFPLRDLPRKTAGGRILVMTIVGMILVIDVAVAVFS